MRVSLVSWSPKRQVGSCAGGDFPRQASGTMDGIRDGLCTSTRLGENRKP
ncbi:hypothetical protein [Hyperthermus butylicus]|nr:hypothetical protein [Hyperthermus butylicus]